MEIWNKLEEEKKQKEEQELKEQVKKKIDIFEQCLEKLYVKQLEDKDAVILLFAKQGLLYDKTKTNEEQNLRSVVYSGVIEKYAERLKSFIENPGIMNDIIRTDTSQKSFRTKKYLEDIEFKVLFEVVNKVCITSVTQKSAPWEITTVPRGTDNLTYFHFLKCVKL